MSKRKADVSPVVRGMQALRFSGAAGKHKDKRTKRARTRAANKARSINEQN